MNTDSNVLLGIHCSAAKGLWNAFTEAQQLRIDTFQIATRNLRRWSFDSVTEEEIEKFHAARQAYPVDAIVSHACYLINIVSDNREVREKSIKALAAELLRCHQLQIEYVVFHPGSSSRPFSEVIQLFRASIDSIFSLIAAASPLYPKLAVENTAGQGKAIGWNLEQIAELLAAMPQHASGYCFDTCHLFAAGYDLRTEAAFQNFLHQWRSILPVEKLLVWHLNDSRTHFGSRVDRHEHIGRGELGIFPFVQILQIFPQIPKILETPKENDMDRKNLELLRMQFARRDTIKPQLKRKTGTQRRTND